MALNNVSKTQPMREGEIATIDTVNEVVDKLNNIAAPTVLFDGTWSKLQEITINNLSDYSLFAVFITGEPACILVFCDSNNGVFSGGAPYLTGNNNTYDYYVRATRTGNKLLLDNAGYMRTNVSTPSPTTATVSKIYGIL